MFKYIEVLFYSDEKKLALDFVWYSRSAQLNRAHLFSSAEHDRVRQYFKWSNFIPVNVANEVESRALMSAGIRSTVVDEVVPRALKNITSVEIQSAV